MQNIKFKLMLLLLLVGLIPAMTIFFLSYNSANQSLREEVFNSMEMYVGLTDSRMIEYFENRVSDSIVLGRTPEIYQSMEILRNAGWDTESPQWLSRVPILENYTNLIVQEQEINLVLITDTEGKVVFTSSRQSEGTDLSNRIYVQEALRGTSSYSDPTRRKIIFPNSVVVSAPVRAEGTSFGVVIGTISLFFSDDIIGGLVELGESADSYLINADGMILTDTARGGHEYNASRFKTIDTEAVHILGEQLRRGNVDFIGQAEYENYMGNEVLGTFKVTRFGYHPVGLVVEVDRNDAFATLRKTLVRMLIIGFATVFVVGFAGLYLGDRIAKPVQKVADAMPELLKSFMQD